MNDILFSPEELVSACNGRRLAGANAAFAGVSSVITDSRKDCSGALFIPLKGESFDGHEFISAAVANGAAAVLSEPGRVTTELQNRVIVIEVEDTTQAYQDLALFHRLRFRDLKVVAVTGSSGKTSTKEMMRAIFVAAYGEDAVLATEGNTNNQVGVPQNLLRLTSRHRIAVLEMGTNHHGEIAPLSHMARPDVAVITFIGNCHLEHLGSLDGVAAEKSMIFSSMNPTGTAVIPFAGHGMAVLEKKIRPYRKLRFGVDPAADICCRYLGGHLHGSTVELDFKAFGRTVRFDWSLAGAHQACNAAAAAAAAMALDIQPETIAAGLAGCKLPGMRMRITQRDSGTVWINDAYNANPDSMASSLRWLAEFAAERPLLLVLGDMLELGEYAADGHRQVLELAGKLFPLSRIVAVGREMAFAGKTIPPGLAARVVFCDDSSQAVDCIKTFISPGMTVFLKGSRGMKLEIIEQTL